MRKLSFNSSSSLFSRNKINAHFILNKVANKNTTSKSFSSNNLDLASQIKSFMKTDEQLFSISSNKDRNANKIKLQHSGKDIINYLTERKAIAQTTHEDLNLYKGDKVYIGFDPTANKLHLGNMFGILNALRCSAFGVEPVFVVGGATGLIGDPSGKNKERPQLLSQEVENNTSNIVELIDKVVGCIINSEQYKNFYNRVNQTSFDKSHIIQYSIINNKQFYENINIIEFLREVGGHLRMSQLLSKDVVKNRLSSESGLSLTEFMYQSFQAYDFYRLNKDFNVKIQLGGSDQWGNMLAGLELINKIEKSNVNYSKNCKISKNNTSNSNDSKDDNILNNNDLESYIKDSKVMNITHPLITTSCGKKLGKSEGNAILICDDNPNSMYQYIYNLSDIDLEHLLLRFTFLPKEEISEILVKHFENPELRYGQKKLAETILLKYCSKDRVDACLFNSENFHIKELNIDFFNQSEKKLLDKEYFNSGVLLSTFCRDQNLVTSRNQLKKLIQMKSVKINNNIVTEDKIISTENDFFNGEYILVQTSKTKKFVFQCNI